MHDPISITYDEIKNDLFLKAAQEGGKRLAPSPKMSFVQNVAIWVAIFVTTLIALRFPIVERGSATFLVGVFFTLAGIFAFMLMQRRKVLAIFTSDQTKRGVVKATFDPDGCNFTSSYGASHLTWFAIDSITDLGTGTGLRCGLSVYPLPDASLPAGVSPTDFRQALSDWKAAA